MPEKVIVIGGGVGGLTGAVRLARMGYDVRLFEKNKTLGGKMGRLSMKGYTFDTGPTLITMPQVLEEMFRFAGTTLSAHLGLKPVDPVCRYFFPGDVPFDASASQDIMMDHLRRSFSQDAENYSRFMSYAGRIYRSAVPVFIESPVHEIRKTLRWKHVPGLLRMYQIDPFRTVHQAVSRYFSDHRLVQLFDRYATYNGSDPYRAPATLNVIPYVELGLGGFYIQGGLYRLVETLEKLARISGVRIHTGIRVNRVLHDGGQVRGIAAGGEQYDSKIVLCNADVVVAHQKLIPGFPRITRRYEGLEPSLSGVIFFWGMRGFTPQLKQHNILFSGDYRTEFRQIFQALTPPDDPTVYISISSRADAAHAPGGCENWFVLVNVPYMQDGGTWHACETDRIRQSVLKKLRDAGMDIENRIACETVLTPADIADRFESNAGSIYGISSNTRSSAFRRPPNRSRRLRGLYFCGGSTHPGGGVPMCMLSAKISAELIREYTNV